MIVAATTYRSVGLVIGLAVVVGVIVYGLANLRAGRKEVGSEVELAANRKPYLPDEQLEGHKLDVSLSLALLLLVVIGVGLPLYWLREPGRQADAAEGMNETFVGRGEALYEEQCSRCHGGAGSGAVAEDYALTVNGEFIDQVDWRAPELDSVMLRYSREELLEILDFGRPGTPMPAWGAGGGGPLTPQQLENLADYLESLKPYDLDDFGNPVDHDEAGLPIVFEEGDDLPPGYAVGDPVPAENWVVRQAEIDDEVARSLCEGRHETAGCVPEYDSRGEALFNLGRTSGFRNGAYACARCHTAGWSWAYPGSSSFAEAGGEAPELTAQPGPAGGGGFAANLWSVDEKFSESVGKNGEPLLLRVDEEGLARTLPGPGGELATAMTNVAVVETPEGPILARDEFGELLVVDDDGNVLAAAGTIITELNGNPVVVVDAVAIDADGAAIVRDGELAEVGDAIPFSRSMIDFVGIGGEDGASYGDGIVSQGAAQMPGFGGMLTDADIAAIVEYERSLDASNARREYVDPNPSDGGEPQ